MIHGLTWLVTVLAVTQSQKYFPGNSMVIEGGGTQFVRTASQRGGTPTPLVPHVNMLWHILRQTRFEMRTDMNAWLYEIDLLYSHAYLFIYIHIYM